MGVEIERKFLVTGEGWRAGADAGVAIAQGYLSSEPRLSVRVRLKGERGFLTVKGAATGCTRSEYEYEIPSADAAEMLRTLCLPEQIQKTRYHVPVGRHTWEVDVFHGANAPLVLAELELASADEAYDRPAWLGAEVTDDPRYLNAQLAANPYGSWAKSGRVGGT